MSATIKGKDGFTSRGGNGICAQSVSKVVSAQSYMVIQTTTDTIIGGVGDFELIITPQFNNSKFFVDIIWNGEVQVPWDTMFNIMRDGVRLNIGGLVGVGSGIGVTTDPYFNDFATTIGRCQLFALDTTGSIANTPITYQLTGITNNVATGGCYTNRTATATPNAWTETATSHMRVTEYMA